MVKNLPAMWKTCVRSLGWEDPPEKRMATHSSVLAWRIPWTEEPGRLTFTSHNEYENDDRSGFFFLILLNNSIKS